MPNGQSACADTASRADGLARLAAFVPNAGRHYAAKRNTDFGPGRNTSVSMLSPYIRHRLITEHEAVVAVLAVHSPSAAEKFIQEVCWRTYWKGWLEQRPHVWTTYLRDLEHHRATLRGDDALAAEVAAAERGDTGFACFDAWARELAEHGYLHNHTRMWFASIWIFTLKLPWVLGADFFMRHLLDGDPASNTLSWRWVAGLHTRGKTYLARADNIATHTNGRFQPKSDELAAYAAVLEDDVAVERVPLRPADPQPAGGRAVLLVTEEDLTPESWLLHGVTIAGVALCAFDDAGPSYNAKVRAFKARALADCGARAAVHFCAPVNKLATVADLHAFAGAHAATCIVTSHIPVGYVATEIEDWSTYLVTKQMPLVSIARRWDSMFWPHAKAGFFQLKDRIPSVLSKLGVIVPPP